MVTTVVNNWKNRSKYLDLPIKLFYTVNKKDEIWTRWLFVVNGTVDEWAEVEPTQRIHTGTPTPIKWNKSGKNILEYTVQKMEYNPRELK